MENSNVIHHHHQLLDWLRIISTLTVIFCLMSLSLQDPAPEFVECVANCTCDFCPFGVDCSTLCRICIARCHETCFVTNCPNNCQLFHFDTDADLVEFSCHYKRLLCKMTYCYEPKLLRHMGISW